MVKIIPLVLFAVFLISCNIDDKSKEEKSNNSIIKIDPDSKIDSAVITSFIKMFFVSDSIGEEVNQFYKRRNYKFAWFNKDGMTYATSFFYNQLQNYKFNFADSSLNTIYLDTLMHEAQKDEHNFVSNKHNLQQLELSLTTIFFKYAKKAYGGKAKSLSELEWFIPRHKKDYQIALDSLILLTKGEKEQVPLNEHYFLLKVQLKKYRNIQKEGNLPFIENSKVKFSIGDTATTLLLTKKYFYLTGDLKRNDGTNIFTDSLVKAIKMFQRRMGLVESGNVNDTSTIFELNQPIAFRIKQIMINMERLRWLPVEMESNYILVNIPEFKLHVFENGKQIWTTNIVVGKSVSQTSIFKDNVSQIILNPYWVIPTSIVQNEIIPHIKRNPSYLTKNNMEVLSGNKIVNPSRINWNSYKGNVPFTFRQMPGKNNALGKMKFLFPNSYDIYLHDTPSKNLFGDTKRAFSHGCIRIEDPEKLVLQLLKNDTKWDKKKIDKILQTSKEVSIHLITTMPIYILYFTTWVDNDGQLNFRNDLYDLDKKLSREIYKE